MTVILDPGNKPESYSDSARRQWQNTAGLWKTDYGTQTTNLTNMTASRDYWQHTVAHNDPNVWTNQYNAGYAAGDAAGYTRGYNTGYAAGDAAGYARGLPPGFSRSLFSLSGVPNTYAWARATLTTQTIDSSTFTNQGSYLQILRTGYYAIWAESVAQWASGARIYADNSMRAEALRNMPSGAASGTIYASARWFSGPIGTNIYVDGFAQGPGGYGGSLEVVFVPINSYPK